MNAEPPADTARYATLPDYLRVLRRYRILIALLALIGAAAGFAYTLRQATTYKATAEVDFQDPAQNQSIVGLSSNDVQPPGQVAAVASQLVTTPGVMNEVRGRLHTSLPAPVLASAISSQVNVPSYLLEISATSSDASFSARLADTTARVLAARDNAQVRAQYAHVAATISHRISGLSAGGRTSPATASELAFYEDELGRLQTLASFATTATFAKPAVIVANSPSKSRGTLIGLALGLLLGIVVAFLRDSTDRRVRDGHDYQSAKLPVLARVRRQALGRVVHITEVSRKDGAIELDTFRILRRNLELLRPESPPKAIVVTSAVAEEGKSSVAGSVAAAFASAGRRTLLVEGDLRRPSLAERLGVAQAPGLADYLAGVAVSRDTLRTIRLNDATLEQEGSPWRAEHPVTSAGKPLVFIPAGTQTTRSTELLGSPLFRKFVEEVTDAYDVVVFDATPLLPVSDALEILPWVDAAVLCVREGHTTLDQVTAAKDALARFPNLLGGIVVTGVKPRGSSEDVYAHTYQYS
jgi:succinoglycan biosynthesis transport protein ExoP